MWVSGYIISAANCTILTFFCTFRRITMTILSQCVMINGFFPSSESVILSSVCVLSCHRRAEWAAHPHKFTAEERLRGCLAAPRETGWRRGHPNVTRPVTKQITLCVSFHVTSIEAEKKTARVYKRRWGFCTDTIVFLSHIFSAGWPSSLSPFLYVV